MRTTWAVALAILVVGCSAVRAEDGVTLAKDGQATAVIVVSEKASPSEQFAAEELRDHVKRMSGADLRIEHSMPQASEAVILIGGATINEAAGEFTGEGLGDDGFTIDVGNNGITIAGGFKRGTLYGVYALLERLGVRWWTPTETYIPAMKTVVAPAMKVREVPKLEYRDMMYNEMFSDAGRLWAARNKVNGMAWDDTPAKLGGRYEFAGNLVHSYMGLLAKSGMEITPEMQALVSGKRTKDQPCLTNPDTEKAMVAGVLKTFEEHPAAKFVVVGQQDNRNYCRCPTCQTMIEKEGESGPVIDFANRVATDVEKARPGSCIATAAYEWSRKPPKTLRPRDNVYITLCSIECDFAHPLATATNDVNAGFREDMEAWGKIAKKIYIWDYTTNFWHFLMPHPNLDVLTPNIKFFADNGAAGVFEQGAHTGNAAEMTPLRMWVLAKSLWNPEADGKALIEEFVNGYYGPAAPGILKYIDATHAPVRGNHDVMRIYRGLNSWYISPDVIAQAMAALEPALEAAEESTDPAFQRRVRHAAMPVAWVMAKRGPDSATWKAAESAVGKVSVADIAELLEKVVTESKVTKDADGESVQPWIDWLKAYAAQCGVGTAPMPSELKDARPGTYRLIQACMMDGRSRWYEKVDGATDGWAVKCPTVGWTIRHYFSPWDDYTPGKTYRLYVRAMVPKVNEGASGVAWQCGIHGEDRGPTLKVQAADVKPGQWETYEVGQWKPTEGKGGGFWIALAGTKAIPEVYMDCMWLVEQPAQP